MSDTKFTPGPWEADKRGGGCVRGSTTREFARGVGRLQVALATGGPDVDPEEVTANTHLIAAAPELYAALERFAENHMEWCETLEAHPNHSLGCDCGVKEAREALEKARGE